MVMGLGLGFAVILVAAGEAHIFDIAFFFGLALAGGIIMWLSRRPAPD